MLRKHALAILLMLLVAFPPFLVPQISRNSSSDNETTADNGDRDDGEEDREEECEVSPSAREKQCHEEENEHKSRKRDH